MASDPYGSPDDGLELERIAVRDAMLLHFCMSRVSANMALHHPGRPLLCV